MRKGGRCQISHARFSSIDTVSLALESDLSKDEAR